MSNTHPIAEKLDGFSDIPLQATSEEIWCQKFCLKDGEGNPVDQDIEATYVWAAS